MNRPRAFSSAALVCLLLGGCGPAANTPVATAPTTAATDVIVTIDGQHHGCIVALYSEAQGSTIACDDVMPFIRDELRVPSGGAYDIRTIAEFDQAELAKVESALKAAGYHAVGSPHAMPNPHASSN